MPRTHSGPTRSQVRARSHHRAFAVAVRLALPLSMAAISCADGEIRDAATSAAQAQEEVSMPEPAAGIHVAKLGATSPGLERIREIVAEANPGYALAYAHQVTELSPVERRRIAFAQGQENEGEVLATFRVQLTDGSTFESDVAVGDIAVLRPGDAMSTTAPVNWLVFSLPEDPGLGATDLGSLPALIRPDWDPNITDTPGGCATEEGAYRRILLTWLESVGSYVQHELNAHRVRITDSFTHYHPRKGGFDEFYLVQMTRPGAQLLTSANAERIEDPDALTADDASGLLHALDLEVGDLIYIPRGTAHRGLGGVLTQVITIPGFKPGAEIGLDHHLHQLNERLGLTGDDAVPLHAAAALEAVVK